MCSVKSLSCHSIFRVGPHVPCRPRQACSRKRASLGCGQRNQPGTRAVSSSALPDSRAVGLLLEVDGAVVDVHLDGHRVAFNAAFHSIGMDCVHWSAPVYHDLLGRSDGTGEGLVTAYYTTVGWPLMLATSDRPAFVRRVHQLKERELGKLLQRDGLPLRPDVKQVISDAVAGGAGVSLLAGTQCTLEGELAASVARLLGPDLAGAVRVFTFTLVPPAQEAGGGGGGEAGGEEPTLTLSQMLSAASEDLKQRAAMQLVCSIKSASDSDAGEGPDSVNQHGVGVTVDPSLMAAGGSQQRLSPEFLAALVATTGVAAGDTVAVAASNTMLQAAAGAGLVPVAVPRRFATQGSFPAARAKFEGFGPGLATWPRLRSLLSSGASQAGK